jgi:hypothetical protein
LKCKYKEKELTDKDWEILKAVELAIIENSNRKKKLKIYSGKPTITKVFNELIHIKRLD